MDISFGQLVLLAVVSLIGLVIFIIIPLSWRRVVETNEFHVVQSAVKTMVYGAQSANGNAYYEIPSWIPVLGVVTTYLPANILQNDVENYEGRDSGNIPFFADIRAFFRISDATKAAQRIASSEELEGQLVSIIQGAARAVFAKQNIEDILSSRSELGKAFTDEVDDKLSAEFGVVVIGHIEVMDIRDTKESKVIHNLMTKKQSLIEMESATVIAENSRKSELAKIEAARSVEIQKQEASQAIGLRTQETEREVAIAEELKEQAIAENSKLTRQKQMEVIEIENVRQAEILKKTEVIKAEQQKQVMTLQAEADLELKRKASEGIALEGKARAEAETAMQMAPVDAQVKLAKEIGQQKGYQEYLVRIEQVKAQKDVGIASAAALQKAEIKIIANTGDAQSGLNSAMDIFSSKGGIQLGAMLEGFANTDTGKAVLEKAGVKTGDEPCSLN